MISPAIRNTIWRVAGQLLLWTSLGLFFTVQSVLTYVAQGNEARLGAPLIYQLGYWYVWGLLSPLMFLAARRWPIGEIGTRQPGVTPGGRSPHRGNVLRLIGLSLVMAPLQVVVSTLVRSGGMYSAGIISEEVFHSQLGRLLPLLPIQSFDALFTFWVILGVYLGIRYYRQSKEQDLANQRLQADLSDARLQNLRAQLRPHFLFNTLNSISALVAECPDRAEQMIARLSHLLRRSLDSDTRTLVPVVEEMDFIRTYLEIEETRFGDRLSIEIDVQPETELLTVPALILQPLVENAVVHGVAPFDSPGRITVMSRLEGDVLCLSVRDTGPGVPPGTVFGIGLSNTRSRLAQLYGEAAELKVDGNLVTIRRKNP